ncbi:outer membrane beta-barrel protein [Vitreimonas sp.]|jgi:hypothetical protein|uniref:outer membrane beta-barrel protein n=1 Tax=Vitreimonas sp. TaxID=3069702 RepID=UPI002ED9A88C
MTGSDTPRLERQFPLCAQHVAPRCEMVDRSMGKKGRFRAGLLRGSLATVGGYLVRVNPALSLFAASLIAFAPVHALAQDQQASVSVRDRPREEYDPLGLRFGGFTLNATLDLSAASTDNVFAEETGADEDVIYAVAPSARVRSNWSRHAIQVEAGGRFESHEDFSSEDADTNFARFYGRLDVGARSTVALSASTAHEVESRTEPDAPTGGDPVEYDRQDVALTAVHTFNRFKLTGGVAQRTFEFDGTQNIRDNEETSIRARVDAELTPRIGLVLQAVADERDYDNHPTPAIVNSEGRTLLAGVSVNFTDLMRGEINVGQFEREYDAGNSVEGLAVAANLEWYPTGLTTVTVTGRRNTEDVIGATESQPFTETEFGARVDHELLRNLILTAGAQIGRRDYESIDREDEVLSADVGADYLINRRVALRARYVFDDVQSSGIDRYRDFEANAFTLGLSFRL